MEESRSASETVISEQTGQIAAELLDVIGPLPRVLRRRAREGWPLEPLATAQVELLRAVRTRPGLTIGEAASELRIAPNTASTLTNQLVAVGFVRRAADPRDRRSVRLTLTPAAEARIAAWRDRRHHVLEQALAGMDRADGRAIVRALPALRKLLGTLE
ncbi:MAG: MarR family winged helix-turn-helix transcriptional regulator [Gaiellales bacterium]